MNDMNESLPPHDVPKPSVHEMQRAIAAELSLTSRLAHTSLLLVSLAGAAVTGTLLLTEPDLPLRTQAAFAVLTVMALSWAGFAAWVLTRRRVLLASHRVVAARMAVAFTAVFALGAWALGRWGDTGRTWYGAAGLGVAMFAIAVLLLLRARQRYEHLSRYRDALEQRLGTAGAASR